MIAGIGEVIAGGGGGVIATGGPTGAVGFNEGGPTGSGTGRGVGGGSAVLSVGGPTGGEGIWMVGAVTGSLGGPTGGAGTESGVIGVESVTIAPGGAGCIDWGRVRWRMVGNWGVGSTRGIGVSKLECNCSSSLVSISPFRMKSAITGPIKAILARKNPRSVPYARITS